MLNRWDIKGDTVVPDYRTVFVHTSTRNFTFLFCKLSDLMHFAVQLLLQFVHRVIEGTLSALTHTCPTSEDSVVFHHLLYAPGPAGDLKNVSVSDVIAHLYHCCSIQAHH